MPPKRRRKFHGLYYHSSPPKILPMNGNSQQNGNKTGRDDGKDAFVVKPSNIRIWIHDKDVGKLTRVLWTGQANRLRSETSTNPKVRKFLENVPYVMNVIKNVHQAVIDNNLEVLQSELEDPPPSLMATKDGNGLTVIHKAAGLGHGAILDYLLKLWPNGVTAIDTSGKTPLHWAASAKNNTRCYNQLVEAGADQEALDYRMKTALYYRAKPNDLDRSFLSVTPDAPRVPHDIIPDWSALVDDIGSLEEPTPELVKRRASDATGDAGFNLIASHSDILDIEAISEPDLTLDGMILDSEESQMQIPVELPNANGSREETATPKPQSPPPPEIEKPSKNEDEDEEVEQETGNFHTEDKEFQLANDTNISTENGEISTTTTEVTTPDIETESTINDDQIDDDINEKNNINDNDDNSTDEAYFHNEPDATSGDETEAANKDNTEDCGNGEEANNDNNNDNMLGKKSTTIDQNNEADDDNNQLNSTKRSDLYYAAVDDAKDHRILDNIIQSGSDDDDDDDEDDDDKQDTKDDGNEDDDTMDEADDDDDQTMDESDDDNNKNENIDDKTDGTNQKIITKQTDDNHNSIIMKIPSPSTELAIEGLVQGEADDNQVQSQSAVLDDETKIKTIIDSGDMEQLAMLVLNGEGNKLIGLKSEQPEIQAFLDNVTSYMAKIRRVHQAARDGNIRDLQSALDRRKFAIAKDSVSPHGATPLHVATIFGHAGIIRYLAGRFPETTTAVDENGRTSLHYAATVKDNGHFFNLLCHFGSNPKLTDKLGNIPDFYKNTEQTNDILSHKQLLKDYGANETVELGMLNDQVLKDPDIPMFQSEQGKYLASSKWLDFLRHKQPLNLPSALGEPLIKGLTEIAEKRPIDPILYLAEYLIDYVNLRNNTEAKQLRKKIEKTKRMNESSNGLVSSSITSNHHFIVHAEKDEENLSSIPPKPDPPQLEHHQSEDQEDELKIDHDDEQTSTPKLEDRDEHGQSMLHFACSRAHSRNALYQLIEESKVDITYRDELYRTARDVALQASQPGNAKDIDRYVISLAALGETKQFEEFSTAGYDHILDCTDSDGKTILDVTRSRGNSELSNFLEGIREFEISREQLHSAIRMGNFEQVQEITALANANVLIKAKNYFGRTALHIAILKESEEIVEYFLNICHDVLKIGDNLERTPLHYAMGIIAVEKISRILIKKGAKRTIKDLKGRQPSYYFMNKSDILRLKEEEEDENRIYK